MAENEQLIVSCSVWKHELGPSKQWEGWKPVHKILKVVGCDTQEANKSCQII